MKHVFLDYASTTPVDKLVFEAMRPYLSGDFGNPSSPHAFGREARKAVEDAREILAHGIGAHAEEIVFTSGATESNNQAIFGTARTLESRGKHVIISKTDHHSVVRPAEQLKEFGFDVTFLDVDHYGRVDPEAVRKAITPKTILIAVMHASNEVGTFQPVQAIGKIAREHKVSFLVDAVQTVGHIPVRVEDLQCDLLSFSGHKFYGPKGVGALYVRKGTTISSYLWGGDQERGRRASTQNVPGIVGMGRAFSLCHEKMIEEIKTQTTLRDLLMDEVTKTIAGVILNGHPTERLPNNAHFSFEGIDGESLLMSLDMNGFCVSMGSACTSGALTPSHVLTAMCLPDKLALGSLRVTIGRWTTREQISLFCAQLKKSVEQLRRK
ncbi:MAG: cysteine desulfurase [Candidatus Omnitrophica bacterium]|nr:cysteine desulfurase [Candidatus Omnitrophota bacterium]